MRVFKNKKEASRSKRHRRILMRMSGDARHPRLVVKRSLKHMHVQIIDDAAHVILVSGSTVEKGIRQQANTGSNIKQAQLFGTYLAKKAIEKGVSEIVFDRAGYLYHGRIKAFAEALRKGGLKF